MAISTNQFKNGMTLDIDGDLFNIIDFQHVKPGKGGAFVRTKLRNLKNGRVVDQTYRAGEKFEVARIERRQMQFLYNDGNSFHFMDIESYEQSEIPADFIGDSAKWMTENMQVQINTHEGRPLGVELPLAVELEVTETDAGIKGDTVQGGSKPATLVTGAVVQVPLFVEVGNRIRVDTRTGDYIERA